MAQQLELFTNEVVPVPECAPFMLDKYGGLERVASLMVEAARRWRAQHPGRDVLSIVPRDWKEYIKANI